MVLQVSWSINRRILEMFHKKKFSDLHKDVICGDMVMAESNTTPKFLMVTHFQTNNINENYEIYLDGCKLARVEEAKFLGITIDENLTWKKQIDDVCKRCARNSWNIGILNKGTRFLPEQALHKLYCTLILPYLNYGLLLWGNGNKTCLDTVYKLQKGAFRSISKFPVSSAYKRFIQKV